MVTGNFSPDEIRQRALAYYTAVDGGDLDALLDVFSADATYLRPGYPPIVGRAELRTFYAGTRVIDSGTHTVETAVVEGDQAAVRGHFSGVLKDGSQVEVGFADFLVFDDEARVFERITLFQVPAV